jgi:hypothetical protein
MPIAFIDLDGLEPAGYGTEGQVETGVVDQRDGKVKDWIWNVECGEWNIVSPGGTVYVKRVSDSATCW